MDIHEQDKINPYFKYQELETIFRKLSPPLNNPSCNNSFRERFGADKFQYVRGSLYNAIQYLIMLCDSTICDSLQNVLDDYNITEDTLLSEMNLDTFYKLKNSLNNIPTEIK